MAEPSGHEARRVTLSPQAYQRIAEIVASAPPLTEEQKRRLRELLLPVSREVTG